MTGFPGVSFLVPVYNKRPYLKPLVAGLRHQRGDFAREFIFVDDGSTDGSREALVALTAGLADVRILAQPNRGPSVATNRAIATASLPMLKLVDADDALLPDATRLLLELMAAHPQAVLAYGRGEQYRSADDALQRIEHGVEAVEGGAVRCGHALGDLLRQMDLAPTNCLIRAEVARAVGGCDERVFTQDYSLLLRLAAAGPFVGTDALVALSAASVAGRINDGGPQVLHDMNLALSHFLAERPVPNRLAGRAARHALTRAWLWARRRERAGTVTRWWAMRLLGWLPIAALRLALLRRSCDAFTLSRPVRTSRRPQSGEPIFRPT